MQIKTSLNLDGQNPYILIKVGWCEPFIKIYPYVQPNEYRKAGTQMAIVGQPSSYGEMLAMQSMCHKAASIVRVCEEQLKEDDNLTTLIEHLVTVFEIGQYWTGL